MKGKITRILPMKKGKNFPVDYHWVDFVLEDGSYASTNICPSFGNFKHWRGKLVVGNILGELAWKDEKARTLNADACPTLLTESDWTPPPPKPPPEPPPQMTFL